MFVYGSILFVMIQEELNVIQKELTKTLTSDNEIISEVRHFLCNGSKKIRSSLALLYLKASNKQINEQIITLLTAGEIIHNASLLHDDVLDNSDLRRGEETIQKKFSPKISILAGDLLLSYATEKLLLLNNNKIFNAFIDCTKKMSKAEIEQFLLRGKLPTEEEYIKITEGKTASLFEAIMQSSAILSGLDVQKSKDFGKLFGTVFQIRNDLERKSKENDVQNGVKTAISVLGVEKTINLIDNYKEKMREKINCFPNIEYSEALRDLADKL